MNDTNETSATATPELDLNALLEQDRQRRAQEFAAYLEQGLKQYKVRIIPVVTLEGTNVQAGLKIVAL